MNFADAKVQWLSLLGRLNNSRGESKLMSQVASSNWRRPCGVVIDPSDADLLHLQDDLRPKKKMIPKVNLHDACIENSILIVINVSKTTLDALHPGMRVSYDLFAYHSKIVWEAYLSSFIPSYPQMRKLHSYRMTL
jgi:hypothetical protein